MKTILQSKVIYPGILLVLFLSLLLPQKAVAGADVQNGFLCTLNPLDSGFPETVTSTETHSVITPTGNSVLVCKFTGPEDTIYESAYQNQGFLCGTFAGTTYNSKVVITPSGNVIFTCHVHPPKNDEENTVTASQPPGNPPPAASNGNDKENRGNNGNSAQHASEDAGTTSVEQANDPPSEQGPGNSGNHGNGNANGHGNGNGNGGGNSGNRNGNGGGNGNGNGNGKKDG